MAGSVTLPPSPRPGRTPPQLRASNPASHVWVSASAGTGKTQVLTDRMLRLMLAGSPPERILALTFTRAAAAEMQNRLTGTLSRWLRLPDADLALQLEILGVTVNPAALRRARELFALSLDVPGGLKVQTLHGFAQGLLAAFPLEAGLPPGFTALDERDTLRLKGRALNEMIVAAQDSADARLLDDLAELAIAKGEGGVTKALGVLQSHAEAIQGLGAPAAVEPAVRRWFGLAEGETAETSLQAMLAPSVHDDGRLRAYADAMEAWGADTGRKNTSRARGWLADDAAGRATGFAGLRSLALTQKDEPKVEPHAVRKQPQLRGIIDDMAHDILQIEAQQAKFAIADTAARHLRVGLAFTARYAALKRAQVAIDYDDMIAQAGSLLGAPGIPGWVAWKLDSRFDHILVDEAQDTNRAQWDIIGKLSEDYFTGDDDMSRARSLFVVGDMKQAIYGFQGTDPKVFAAEQKRIAQIADQSGRPLETVPLDTSFRSGPAVLEVVNGLVAHVGAAALGMEDAVAPHVPHRATAASQVVLWPVQVPPVAVEDDATDDEAADAGQEQAEQLMADILAGQVRAWLMPGDAERLWLPAQMAADGTQGRWARPEDILILFRKRAQLMTAVVGALHAASVPVAGVDRLLLTEPYAVLDLLALVRFAVQPEDDLNLACLLVSPFIGWDHEAVRRLSQPRRASLWAALRADDSADAQAAQAWLGAVLGMADLETPYRFLDSILSGPLEGRRKLIARLGSESVQAIDELLSQALAFEAAHPPALQGFLAWITADGVEVKRESDAASSEVRLMTIHGAKGLEAPVVVLADAAHSKRREDASHVMVRLAGHAADVPLFHGGAKLLSGQAKALQEARLAEAQEEDLRLLYVALTRAADHLFIGGGVGAQLAKSLGSDEDTRWHTRLGRVFSDLPAGDVETIALSRWQQHAAEGQGMLRLKRGSWSMPGPDSASVAADPARLEIWSRIETGPAPAPARPPRPLTPSALGRDDVASPPPTQAMRDAAVRGRLLHSLFERLPPVESSRRHAVALAWLKAQGAQNPQEIADSALAVIEAPEFSDLFSPDALAESPIAGVDGDMVIAGTVDRLLVSPERVLVVDFKTGLRVPAALDSVPIPYIRQMAAYRAVLNRAFPGRSIEAGLLYTAAPKLILLPAKLLDAHWPPPAA